MKLTYLKSEKNKQVIKLNEKEAKDLYRRIILHGIYMFLLGVSITLFILELIK